MAAIPEASQAVRQAAAPLDEWAPNYDPLLERIGDARFVLLGEASHGTHEFYRERAEITRRLIEEKGFTAVAVEADWPDAYRVNRYVAATATTTMPWRRSAGFERFPTWMWRNADVARLRRVAARAQRHAAALRPGSASTASTSTACTPRSRRCSRYLDKVDPEAAGRARDALRLLRPFRRGPPGLRLRTRLPASPSPASTRSSTQLVELQRRAGDDRAGATAGSPRTSSSSPSRTPALVTNAEQYYRSMFSRPRLVVEPARPPHGRDARGADRVTSSDGGAHAEGRRLGPQLPPRRCPRHRDGTARRAQSRPARARAARQPRRCSSASRPTTAPSRRRPMGWPGRAQARPAGVAWELRSRCSTTSTSRASSRPARHRAALAALQEPRLDRAIGVIYRPETERASHYFHVRLPDQFDGVIHIDETRAVEPIERRAPERQPEPAETFPSGV